MIKATLVAPMLSTILRDRRLGLAICGVALLQLTLVLAGLPGWPCPVFHALGVPCPGCGLTRAILLLFRGEWKQAIILHAFAPIFLVALTTVIFCAFAPKKHTERIATGAETLERYTAISSLLLVGLIVYWLARLLILQDAFVRLIQG
jgi:Protein of unknown function (DUF2752)